MEREGIAVISALEENAIIFFSGPLQGSLFLARWDRAATKRAEAWAAPQTEFQVQLLWFRDPDAASATTKPSARGSQRSSSSKRRRTTTAEDSTVHSEREQLRAAKVAAVRSPVGQGIRCLASAVQRDTTEAGIVEERWILASAGDDKTIRIFRGPTVDDAETARQNPMPVRVVTERTYPKRFTSIQVSPNSRFVLAADKFGDVYAMDIDHRNEPLASEWNYLAQTPAYVEHDANPEPVMGHLSIVTSLVIDPDGHLIGSADVEGQIRITAFPETYAIQQLYTSCGGDPTWCQTGDFITKLAWARQTETPTLIGGGTGLWFQVKRRSSIPGHEKVSSGAVWDIQGGRLSPENPFLLTTNHPDWKWTASVPSESRSRQQGSVNHEEFPEVWTPPWLCLDLDDRTAIALWGNRQHEVVFTRIPLDRGAQDIALQRLNRRLADACARRKCRLPTAFRSFPLHLFETGCTSDESKRQPGHKSSCLLLLATAFDEEWGTQEPSADQVPTATVEPAPELLLEPETFFFVLPFTESEDASEESMLWSLATACERALNERIHACVKMHRLPATREECPVTSYSAMKHSNWSWLWSPVHESEGDCPLTGAHDANKID